MYSNSPKIRIEHIYNYITHSTLLVYSTPHMTHALHTIIACILQNYIVCFITLPQYSSLTSIPSRGDSILHPFGSSLGPLRIPLLTSPSTNTKTKHTCNIGRHLIQRSPRDVVGASGNLPEGCQLVLRHLRFGA